MFHQRSSDVANSTDINKTNNINYNRFKKYNSYQRARYSPPTAKHTGTSIKFEGEQYEYIAEYGDSIEYRNKNGDKIAKHKWKKDEPIKKFDAIVKVAV